MAKGKKLIYTIHLTDKGTFRIKELDKEVKDLGKAFMSKPEYGTFFEKERNPFLNYLIEDLFRRPK